MVKIDQIENSYLASFNEITKLNILNSNDVELRLLPLVSQSDSTLTLDFTGIKFIDSSGFETLLSLYKVANANNSDLKLKNLSDELIELVNLVKLDTIFQLN
jgi:anti-anti-sigma factor